MPDLASIARGRGDLENAEGFTRRASPAARARRSAGRVTSSTESIPRHLDRPRRSRSRRHLSVRVSSLKEWVAVRCYAEELQDSAHGRACGHARRALRLSRRLSAASWRIDLERAVWSMRPDEGTERHAPSLADADGCLAEVGNARGAERRSSTTPLDAIADPAVSHERPPPPRRRHLARRRISCRSPFAGQRARPRCTGHSEFASLLREPAESARDRHRGGGARRRHEPDADFLARLPAPSTGKEAPHSTRRGRAERLR